MLLYVNQNDKLQGLYYYIRYEVLSKQILVQAKSGWYYTESAEDIFIKRWTTEDEAA